MFYQTYWDEIAWEYCLVSVVQICLKQHCAKKYFSNDGTEHADMFLQENNLYNVVLMSLCQRCTKKLFIYLCNVDPQPINNFAQENNLQCCLDLCWLTLCKEITCAMLAHG